MSEDQLAVFLPDNRTAFRPGETIAVSALWALASAPASIEARLFWRTSGKGTEDLAVVNTQRLAAPGVAGEHAFEFKLPDAPYSFSGKLISLVWAIELVAEPGNKHASCELTLAPDGREILLHRGDGNDAARA